MSETTKTDRAVACGETGNGRASHLSVGTIGQCIGAARAAAKALAAPAPAPTTEAAS